MPKVPIYESKITPAATGVIPTPSPQTAGLVGESIASAGLSLARVGFALDEARKQVELQKSLNAAHGLLLDYETESLADPDWETADTRAETRFQELRDKHASGLKDPKQQEQFGLKFDAMAAPMRIRIRRDAHGKMIDAGRAAFFEALTTADRDYAHAGTDLERQSVLNYAQDLIRGHVERGFLTALEGAKTAEAFVNQVSRTRLEAMIEVEPVRALEELASGKYDKMLRPEDKVRLQAAARANAERDDDELRTTAAFVKLHEKFGEDYDQAADHAGNPDTWAGLGLKTLNQVNYVVNTLQAHAADQRAEADRKQKAGEDREKEVVFGLLTTGRTGQAVAFLQTARYLDPELKYRINTSIQEQGQKQESDPVALSNMIAAIMKDEVWEERAVYATGIHPKDYPHLANLWRARQPKKLEFNYVKEAETYFESKVTDDETELSKFRMTLFGQMRKKNLTPNDPETYELAVKLTEPFSTGGGFWSKNVLQYERLFDERTTLGGLETETTGPAGAGPGVTMMSADADLQPMNATEDEERAVLHKLFQEKKDQTRENKQRALGELRTGKAAPAPARLTVPTEKPPVPGARKAKDGFWYVKVNGKWSRIEQ